MASTLILSALALTSLPFAAAEDARIKSEVDVPDWVSNSAMVMRLSTFGGGELTPYQYTVVPLTATRGLNKTDDERGVCFSITHHCPRKEDPIMAEAHGKQTREGAEPETKKWLAMHSLC